MGQTTEKELEKGRPEIAHSEVVCLVDDDPSVRKSVSRLLESDGFSVRAFSEPQTFLSHVTTNSVPLAFLDIWMERMTGMELLAHLCAKSPQTRVIFITGREDTAAAATVMSAGAFAFLIKPLDDHQFLSAVHRALRHSIPEKDGEPSIYVRSRSKMKWDLSRGDEAIPAAICGIRPKSYRQSDGPSLRMAT